ncbi:MAG: KH domain-containing protein, partial [Candidatus Thermoplasmatota archaeon]
MTVDDVLREIKAKTRKIIPPSIDVSDVEFEGALVVIYTKNPDKFAKNDELVRQLAKMLQKRITVRPDPSVITNTDMAEEKIKEIVPEEAEITNIYFLPESGEVTIEAKKPGIAIGKKGSLLNQIREEINWSPKVIRTPPIQSKTVQDIRKYLRYMTDERKEILRKIGR